MKSTQLSRQNKKIHHWVNNYGLSLNPTLPRKKKKKKKKKKNPNWIAENMITIIDTPHVKHQTNNQETTSQIPLKQQERRLLPNQTNIEKNAMAA